HRRELQLFLRTEVREDPRFAHPQLRRQPPDRQPLQPFGGSQVRCQRKNLLPRSRRFYRSIKNSALLAHRTIVLYRTIVLLSRIQFSARRMRIASAGVGQGAWRCLSAIHMSFWVPWKEEAQSSARMAWSKTTLERLRQYSGGRVYANYMSTT